MSAWELTSQEEALADELSVLADEALGDVEVRRFERRAA